MFFARRTFEIEIPLPFEEAQRRLSEATRPGGEVSYEPMSERRPFRGVVKGNSFLLLRRGTSGRNLQPMAEGFIESNGTGSRITLWLRLGTFSRVMMGMSVVVATLMCAAVARSWVVGLWPVTMAAMELMVMGLIFSGMRWSFYIEEEPLLAELRRVLGAQP